MVQSQPTQNIDFVCSEQTSRAAHAAHTELDNMNQVLCHCVIFYRSTLRIVFNVIHLSVDSLVQKWLLPSNFSPEY
jgi:hypothetical protein